MGFQLLYSTHLKVAQCFVMSIKQAGECIDQRQAPGIVTTQFVAIVHFQALTNGLVLLN